MKIYAAVRVVDLETLGLEPDSGVCEIGWTDVYAGSQNDKGEPTMWEVATQSTSLFVNPGKPIPPVAMAEHHITDADVADAPDFDEALSAMLSIHSLPASCQRINAWAAHNAKFERQFLDRILGNVPWICTMRCSQHVYPDAPSFKNQALRYLHNPRGLNPRKALPPHRAGPDSYVSAFLLRDLLNRGNTVERLVRASGKIPLLLICPIGNDWRGKPFEALDTKALRWLSTRPDSEEIRATAEHWLRERGEL